MLHPVSSDPEFLSSIRLFTDRRMAGRLLASALIRYAGTNPVVLGIPRGGVPVAEEIARSLGGALDVCVARKLGVPGRPELSMGAVAEGPAIVTDRETLLRAEVTHAQLLDAARRGLTEIERGARRFRAGRAPLDLQGRTVILIDDGIATGATMHAAICAVRKHHPSRLAVAVPVAPRDVITELRSKVDEIICLHQQEVLYAIGLWYEDYRPVHDKNVVRILERFRTTPVRGGVVQSLAPTSALSSRSATR